MLAHSTRTRCTSKATQTCRTGLVHFLSAQNATFNSPRAFSTSPTPKPISAIPHTRNFSINTKANTNTNTNINSTYNGSTPPNKLFRTTAKLWISATLALLGYYLYSGNTDSSIDKDSSPTKLFGKLRISPSTATSGSTTTQGPATAPEPNTETTYPKSFITPEPRLVLDIESFANKTLNELSHRYDAEPVRDIPLIFTSVAKDFPLRIQLERIFRSVQNSVTQQICDLEYTAAVNFDAPQVPFRQDTTIRSDGSGGGIARVIQNGKVFEKAGCSTSFANVSSAWKNFQGMAENHEELKSIVQKKLYRDTDKVERFTASISLVFHPVSPHIPTVHANYRYFEYVFPDGKTIFWFGGGSDLTPVAITGEEARYFHTTLKEVCDRHDKSYYPDFKQRCDKYFYSTARGETRGVGGIFFDDLYEKSKLPQYVNFVVDAASNFNKEYFPIVLKNLTKDWTQEDADFKEIRRSRYGEFNLLYDKGTSFGLQQKNARSEAILMSMPPRARWVYKHNPTNELHKRTLQILKSPEKQNWAQ